MLPATVAPRTFRFLAKHPSLFNSTAFNLRRRSSLVRSFRLPASPISLRNGGVNELGGYCSPISTKKLGPVRFPAYALPDDGGSSGGTSGTGSGGGGGGGGGVSGGGSGDSGKNWSLLSTYLKYPVFTEAITSALLTLVGVVISKVTIFWAIDIPIDWKGTFLFYLLWLILVGPTLHCWYLSLLAKYAVLTKAITSTLSTFVGDVICQAVIGKASSIDWKRTFLFASSGIILAGPILLNWYLSLLLKYRCLQKRA